MSISPVPIARGQGVWLYDFDGKRYLDAGELLVGDLFVHCDRVSTLP